MTPARLARLEQLLGAPEDPIGPGLPRTEDRPPWAAVGAVVTGLAAGAFGVVLRARRRRTARGVSSPS